MSDYWISRDAQNMWEYMEEAETTSRRVARVYAKSSKHITEEIDKIFNRYQTKNGLTKEEAYIIINQLENKSSFNLLKRVVSNSSMKNAKSTLAELEAPAYRARIERFENLQSNIDSMMKDMYKQEMNISTNHYKKLAKKSYFKEMFGIQQKSGVGFGVSVDEKAIDKVLKSKWSGSNYSSRIWKNTKELSNDVQELVLEGMLTGESSHKLAQKIQEKYNVGAFEARRLIRTESAYVSNEMKYRSMEDAGIKFYVFNATLDKRTSSVCRGLDLKKFKLSEKQTGVNFPPMHPFCRSIATSVLEGFEDIEDTRIARNPDTGKNMKVPRDMSYADWEEKYVHKNNPNVMDTLEELEEYAKIHLGITGVSLDGVSLELAKPLFFRISENYKSFPEIKGMIKNINSSDMRGYMGITPTSNFDGVDLSVSNKLLQDKNKLEKHLNIGINSGYFNEKVDFDWAVNHEFGHIFETKYINTNLLPAQYEHSWNLCMSAESVLELASLECYDDINKWVSVISEISTYANETASEMLAECIALELSGNGTEFTKAIVGIMRRKA